MTSARNALIIDDTDANRIFFERLVAQADFNVLSAGTGEKAMELCRVMPSLALAIVDMEMPDINGLDLTSKLRQRYPEVCIVVATMHDERSLMESAYARGCDIFLVKPHGFMDLFKKLTSIGVELLRDECPLIIDQYGLRSFKPSVAQR